MNKILVVDDDTDILTVVDLVNNINGSMAHGLVTKPFETSYLLETIRQNIA